MRRPLLLLLLFAAPAFAQPRVPAAQRLDSSDTFFGTRVPDPYRWLERYEQPQIRAWYEAEDAVAQAYLNSAPAYAVILGRLAQARQSRPYAIGSYVERHGRLFYFKRMPDEQGFSLYVKDAFLDERRLIAPAQIAEGAVLTRYDVSPTGAHVAVAYTSGGNERDAFTLVETRTGAVLTGEIPPGVAGLVWQPDGRSFLYGRSRSLGPDATPSALYGGLPSFRHVIGTESGTDAVVFDPVSITGDSTAVGGPGVEAYTGVALTGLYRDGVFRTEETFAAPAEALEQGKPIVWRRVTTLADSVTSISVQGPWLYGVAFRGGARGRLVRMSFPKGLLAGTEAPDWSRAEVVLDEPGLDFWNIRPSYASDGIYWLQTVEGRSSLFRFSYGDRVKEEIPAPFEGSFGNLEASRTRPGVDFVYGGWTQGDRRFRYDPATRRIEELPAFFNPPDPFDHLDGLTVETVLVPSHDGVRVPLTILRVAGQTGPRPTILYGYSAYGNSEDAFFRPQIRPWLEAGGTYAICHARGGGYFGLPWHEAGLQTTKPNTWKDGIACAEHLVRAGLTRTEMLGINGVSAGGIFAGRAITERPDLFGAAVVEVGIADMVRGMRTNAGPGNIHEFGAAETEVGFRALLAMSAYHHVRPGVRYPATLLYAGFNDARVAPWHPAKLGAALRHAGGTAAQPGGARPVLLRVDFGAGHGGGNSVGSQEARGAAVLAFFAARFGLKVQ